MKKQAWINGYRPDGYAKRCCGTCEHWIKESFMEKEQMYSGSCTNKEVISIGNLGFLSYPEDFKCCYHKFRGVKDDDKE